MDRLDYRRFLIDLLKQYEEEAITFDEMSDLLWTRENERWSDGYSQGRDKPDFDGID